MSHFGDALVEHEDAQARAVEGYAQADGAGEGGDHGNRAEELPAGRAAHLLGEQAAGQGHDGADHDRAEPQERRLVADGSAGGTLIVGLGATVIMLALVSMKTPKAPSIVIASCCCFWCWDRCCFPRR